MPPSFSLSGRACSARLLKSVVYPGIQPDVYTGGSLVEDTHWPLVSGVLQLAPNALCNLAGGESSLCGLAVVPSRELVIGLLSAVGFECTPVVVDPDPVAPQDIAIYTIPKHFHVQPVRYWLRCVRRPSGPHSAPAAQLTSLEEMVVTGQGTGGSEWFAGHQHAH